MGKRALTSYDTVCWPDRLSFAQEMRESLRFGSSHFFVLVAKSLSVLEIFRIRAQNEVRFEFATNTILRISPKIEPDATLESLAASFSEPATDRQSHIPSGHCFVIAVSSLSQWRSQFDHTGIISSRKRMMPRREPSRPHLSLIKSVSVREGYDRTCLEPVLEMGEGLSRDKLREHLPGNLHLERRCAWSGVQGTPGAQSGRRAR